MNIQDIKELFVIYLTPIKEDICELKEGQEKLIGIIAIQAKHDVEIEEMRKDVYDCKNNVNKIKENGNKKVWDIIKIGLAGISGAIIAKLF